MNWIECCAMRIEIRSGAEESLLWQVNLMKVVTIIHVNPVIQLIQDISHWKPFFKSICFCLLLLDDSPFLSLFHTFFRNEETMKWLAGSYRKGGWDEEQVLKYCYVNPPRVALTNDLGWPTHALIKSYFGERDRTLDWESPWKGLRWCVILIFIPLLSHSQMVQIINNHSTGDASSWRAFWN